MFVTAPITIVMLSTYALEQLFLRLRGGQMEVLMVLENPAGARHRETLTFPTRNTVETARRTAKHLVQKGQVTNVAKVRVRREERGELKDDDALRRLFISEFNDLYEPNEDDEWD